MVVLYGIKNCDSVKKALKFLKEHHIPHQFHDFRADGLSKDLIVEWMKKSSLEELVNKRSTTWKNLNDSEKEMCLIEKDAPSQLLQHPTLIKRPVLEVGDQILIGYQPLKYEERLKKL